MGLFDFIKKPKNSKAAFSLVQAPLSHDCTNPESGELSIAEISFLKYLSNHDTDLSTFSQGFKYDYGLDYEKTVDKLLHDGYARIGTAAESLSVNKLPELKAFLSAKGLPVSGKKEELIDRILTQASSYDAYFQKRIFILTEKGKETVDKNTPSDDEKFRQLSKQAQIHLQAGELGFYRNDLFEMSEIVRREGRYKVQLKFLVIILYIDLSGFSSVESYNFAKSEHFKLIKPDPMIAPGIANKIQTCMKRLDMSDDQLHDFFIQNLSRSMVPDHILSVDECFSVLQMYFNNTDPKKSKADAFLEKKVAEFVRQK